MLLELTVKVFTLFHFFRVQCHLSLEYFVSHFCIICVLLLQYSTNSTPLLFLRCLLCYISYIIIGSSASLFSISLCILGKVVEFQIHASLAILWWNGMLCCSHFFFNISNLNVTRSVLSLFLKEIFRLHWKRESDHPELCESCRSWWFSSIWSRWNTLSSVK